MTKNEIHQALLSLTSGKSPGRNEFNAEFYHFFGMILVSIYILQLRIFSIMLPCLDPGVKPILL